nr:hypothetical protein Iba_scaffold81097CG0010 [Ipomoea batatas]
MAQFKAKESSSRLEHPISFSKNLFYMCNIPNPKGNCVTIHGTVFKFQGFGISLHPNEGFVLSKTSFLSPLLTNI